MSRINTMQFVAKDELDSNEFFFVHLNPCEHTVNKWAEQPAVEYLVSVKTFVCEYVFERLWDFMKANNYLLPDEAAAIGIDCAAQVAIDWVNTDSKTNETQVLIRCQIDPILDTPEKQALYGIMI